jgi:hypothetical protein
MGGDIPRVDFVHEVQSDSSFESVSLDKLEINFSAEWD